MSDFKQLAVPLIRGTGVDALQELSLGLLLIVRVALKADNEQDVATEVVKSFYLLEEMEQAAVVKAAFEEPGEEFAPIRRLIYELPEEIQENILRSV